MSDDDNSVRVDRLSPGDAADAGRLLASSHADYPGFRHVFPDDAARKRALLPFLVATARDAATHGHALVAHDTSVVGVALWMPPGTFPLSSLRKAAMTPAMLRVAWAQPRSMSSFARLGAALEKAHPTTNAWYLQAMGVDPAAQRRGIGGQLIAPALELADDAGAPCYLQTSDSANIAYYQRFGFEVVQPEITTYPGGPVYIGMTRPAADGTGT